MEKSGVLERLTYGGKSGQWPDTKDSSYSQKGQMSNNHNFEELLNFEKHEFYMMKMFILQKSINRRTQDTFLSGDPDFQHTTLRHARAEPW